MAYAHTISLPQRGADGCIVFVITETDVGLSSEWGPIYLPPTCKMRSFTVARASGSAASRVDPELGRQAAWVTDSPAHLLGADWGSDTPGLYFTVLGEVEVTVLDGALYGRTSPDVAGDAFTTTVVFQTGNSSPRSV